MTIDQTVQFFKPLLEELKEALCHIEKNNIDPKPRDKKIDGFKNQLLDKTITGFLLRHFPYEVLSEEDDNYTEFLPMRNPKWVIQPIDGTDNVLRQIPFGCLSICLWYDEKPQWGLIYDYFQDELFIGSLQDNLVCEYSGAWLNGQVIEAAQTIKKEGVLCTNSRWWHHPASPDQTAQEKGKEWKCVRIFGSTALALAWLACGRIDACLEKDIPIWDAAAGLALVQAAGGQYTLSNSEHKNTVDIRAVNKKISLINL